MTASLMFLSGLGVTLVMAVGAAIYLKSALGNILIELCGTRERAAFWSAFSNIAVTAVPLIFAMQYAPDTGAHTNTAFELVTQLKWGLIGLVATVVTLGWVLSRFIARAAPPSVTAKTVQAMK